MRRWKSLLFGASLLTFGIASAGAVRPVAAQAEECPGTGLLCAKTKSSECTKVMVCGARITFPFALILCCGETTSVTNYYYYPNEM
ncbi:MAG TPA: hypothetical protein VM778_11005 [Gemmatimonadota bacterium]|nr:hypothetical protein [Gemmatimonadota bacterium]